MGTVESIIFYRETFVVVTVIVTKFVNFIWFYIFHLLIF